MEKIKLITPDELHVYPCILGMRFNKFSAWRYFIAHQHTKNPICLCQAFNSNLF